MNTLCVFGRKIVELLFRASFLHPFNPESHGSPIHNRNNVPAMKNECVYTHAEKKRRRRRRVKKAK